MDCTSDVFRRAGVQGVLTVEPERVGGKAERDGEVGESIIVVPQRAQEIWVWWFPGIDEGASSSKRVVVDIGSMLSCPLWIAEITERRVSQFS